MLTIQPAIIMLSIIFFILLLFYQFKIIFNPTPNWK